MKKPASLFLAIALVCISLLPIGVRAAMDVPEEVLSKTASIFYVEVQSGRDIYSGTAFIIKSDSESSLLLTNEHVVQENKNNVTVWLDEKEKSQAKVIAASEQYDLAVLQVAGKLGNALILSENAKQGDAVFAVGFPGYANALSDYHAVTSSQATITDGVISAIRSLKLVEYGPSVCILQTNADINYGNSGGPLFNRDGHVVGVNTYGVNSANGIYGAIGTESVLVFLKENNLFSQLSRADAKGIGEAATEKMVANPDSTSYFTGKPIRVYWTFVLPAIFAIGVIILIVSILANKRKSMIPKKQKATSVLSLDEYLRQLIVPLSCEDIVSLLLPVAKQMRDQHMDGALLIHLSPSSINVNPEGCSINQHVDSSFVKPQFTAPEQISRGIASVQTDIYSFCQLMRYMFQHCRATDANPDAPEDSSQPLTYAETIFVQLVKKGTALEPAERYATMQDVIFSLASLNTSAISPAAKAPFISDVPQNISMPSKTLSKKRIWVICLTTLTMLGAAIAGNQLLVQYMTDKYATERDPERLCFWNNQSITGVDRSLENYAWACHNYQVQNFLKASEQFKNLGEFYESQALYTECRYCYGNQLIENKQYKMALAVFAELSSYKDSSSKADEIHYLQAASFANNGYYDAAIELYESLGAYKDSASLINDTLFRKGYSLLSSHYFRDAESIFLKLKKAGYAGAANALNETYYTWGVTLGDKGEYISAYTMLQKCKTYQDAPSLISGLESILYNMGIDYYRSKQYSKAKANFSVLKQSYKSTKSYLLLINCHDSLKYSTISNSQVHDLIALVGFEDANTLIMAFHKSASSFLHGMWRDSSYYFEIRDDGKAYYNLPSFEYGDYYRFTNGKFVVYKEKTPNVYKTLFTITIIDRNTISVYCAQNGRYYTLTRR